MRNPAVLQGVYNEVFGRSMDYNSFDDRLNIQKTIYILQKMGLDFNEYGYSWYKHGPYSQSVQDDAYQTLHINSNDYTFEFTEVAKNSLSLLKSFIERNPGAYSNSAWLEAIASLHYLRTYFFPGDNDITLVENLKERKPHLNDEASNLLAIELVKEINSSMQHA